MITDEQLKAWRELAGVCTCSTCAFHVACRGAMVELIDEVERLRRLELLVRADERERIAKRIELFNGHVVNKHFVSQFVASGKASGPAEEQDAAMLVRRG